MQIVSTAIEPGRRSLASVEFVIQVTLESPPGEHTVTGRVVGPRAAGLSTVEAAYPLVPIAVSDNAVSLKCVIPEPARWTRERPLGYTWTVTVMLNGEQVDSRSGAIVFPLGS